MRMNIIDVDSREIKALYERVRQRANSNGIPPEEAIRQALRGWFEQTSEARRPEESRDRVLEATEAEYRAIAAILAAMRSYDSRADDPAR